MLHCYFTHLHPLIWIFKRFWCPKWIWQKFCHKKSTHFDHSYLKYALDARQLQSSRAFQIAILSEICIFNQRIINSILLLRRSWSKMYPLLGLWVSFFIWWTKVAPFWQKNRFHFSSWRGKPSGFFHKNVNNKKTEKLL